MLSMCRRQETSYAGGRYVSLERVRRCLTSAGETDRPSTWYACALSSASLEGIDKTSQRMLGGMMTSAERIPDKST